MVTLYAQSDKKSTAFIRFGALYLKPLDLAFGSTDVFYRRYVDDVIVLLKSKRQFSKAKKRLFEVCRRGL